MIRVQSSKLSKVDHQFNYPFRKLFGMTLLRNWIAKLFGKEKITIEHHVTFSAVLKGNHRIISLNDVVIHSNGEQYIVTFKRGSSVVLDKLTPYVFETLHSFPEIEMKFGLDNGLIAVLTSTTRELR